MTPYLLAVHHDGTGPDISPEEMKQSFADIGAFNTKLMDSGALVFPGQRVLGQQGGAPLDDALAGEGAAAAWRPRQRC
jgi:hypothetical protein